MIWTIIHFETGKPYFINSRLDDETLSNLAEYFSGMGREILEVVVIESEHIRYTIAA